LACSHSIQSQKWSSMPGKVAALTCQGGSGVCGWVKIRSTFTGPSRMSM